MECSHQRRHNDSSYPDYQTWRDKATLLDGVIAFKERALGRGDEIRAERVSAMLVTGNYFDVLGVKPALGRLRSIRDQGIPSLSRDDGSRSISDISVVWSLRPDILCS